MKYAFEAENVFKHFGDVKALNGVNLQAKEGTIFGLLGPNGAGKTTLVRMLSTLMAPDQGKVKVQGLDVVKDAQKVRRVIGLAGQYAAVDEFLTGMENLYMVGRFYRLDAKTARRRATEILEELSLSDAANRQVKTYSGGMRRRLDLGASLVGRPHVLFLDEPTTGLDPRSRIELWGVIRDLAKDGTSVLLTTQYLEEADELADRIAVLDRGKIIVEGTSDELKSRMGGDVIEFKVGKLSKKEAALSAAERVAGKKPQFSEDTGTISISAKDGSKVLVALVRELDKQGVEPESLALHRPSLDDVFLAVTGQKTKEENV